MGLALLLLHDCPWQYHPSNSITIMYCIQKCCLLCMSQSSSDASKTAYSSVALQVNIRSFIRRHRLIRQYEADRAVNGELPAEEVSADVLSAVEQNIPAATRHFVEFAATVARAPEQVLT